MKFEYSFQKILDLKGNEKSQAEWMLSEAVANMEKRKSELEILEGEREIALKDLDSSMTNSISVQNLMLLYDYIDQIGILISQKSSEIEESMIIVMARQTHLEECMKQEDIWSKSKEKASEEFTQVFLKKEQEELDDMVTARHTRLSF